MKQFLQYVKYIFIALGIVLAFALMANAQTPTPPAPPTQRADWQTNSSTTIQLSGTIGVRTPLEPVSLRITRQP